MIEFRSLNELNQSEVTSLYTELGIADYTYVELTEYLHKLEEYRSIIHNKIKELETTKNGKYGSSMDTGK